MGNHRTLGTEHLSLGKLQKLEKVLFQGLHPSYFGKVKTFNSERERIHSRTYDALVQTMKYSRNPTDFTE